MYVSVDGEPVLDCGFGFARPEVPMTAATIMLWRSAGKPLTAAAICRLWQDHRIDLDAPLATNLPKTEDRPVGTITPRQLLNHTSGLPIIETEWPEATWAQTLDKLFAIERLTPGNAYQPQSSWFLLGAILEAADDRARSIQTILSEDVLRPLGMNDVWCGIPATEQLLERLPVLYSREAGKLVPNSYGEDRWLSQPSPGGNFRGPVSQLGKFYEMLLRAGQLPDGNQFLNAETARQMTSRHRVGQRDETFQHIVDFGLGLIIDSNQYGTQTVPYGFGQHCSPRTFGHGGAQCAMGFCDPERKLVVTWAANGYCGEGQHQRRNRAINDAIDRDLTTGTAV